jgi:hypothetical protein
MRTLPQAFGGTPTSNPATKRPGFDLLVVISYKPRGKNAQRRFPHLRRFLHNPDALTLTQRQKAAPGAFYNQRKTGRIFNHDTFATVWRVVPGTFSTSEWMLGAVSW